MTQRLRLLYPFGFAVLPILNILTRSPGESSMSDVAVVTGVMLAACALVYGIVTLLARGRASSLVAPLVVFAALVWFYGYDAAAAWARRLAGGSLGPVVVTLALLATVAAVWWLARRPRYLDRATTFLALTGGLLVGWSGAQVVRDQLRARRTVHDSVVAKELAKPLAVKGVTQEEEPHRDIYLIVLDEYANSSVLGERLGFDNRVFEDSLRHLGFTIPRVVRSNYVHTILSLPSLLNFSHLTGLASDVGSRATDPSLPNHLLEDNRSAAFLKARGYRFLFFPSQWWLSTQHNRNADWEFQAWHGLEPGREATRSDLRRSFLRGTVLDLLRRDHAHDADHQRRTLAALARVPDDPRPTFAFAHILNPHRPYVFDAACRILKARATSDRASGRRDGYVGQVQCLNTLLLALVTSLIQHSSPAPVILLQGDHGTNMLDYSSARSAAEVSRDQARERFGAFGAYYVPGGGSRLFTDSVTVVNVMAKVLDYYFNAGIPLAPDSLYMSLERSPYLFARVDPASLALPPSPKPGAPTRAQAGGSRGP
jgi:hypothetical protein